MDVTSGVASSVVTIELTSCSVDPRASPDEAKRSRQKWTPYLVFCNFAIVIGSGFTFGYNMAVVNGPYYVIRQWINETFVVQNNVVLNEGELETQCTLAVSLYLIGGVIGSTWFPNAAASRFGKRNTLIFGAALGAIGEILLFVSTYTDTYYLFLFGRIVTGCQGGLAMTIAPALVNEHAPDRLRGACGTAFTLGLSSGVELANFLGLGFILGSADQWHCLFLMPFLLYLLHGIGLLFCVESPRWLLDRTKANEALNALAKLRNLDENWGVREEFEQLKHISMAESRVQRVSYLEIFRHRQLWWPLLVAINAHITNQFTGFNAVLIYATMVLHNAGLESDKAALANFGITFAIIIGNIICGLTVDRIGRRKLLISGTLGMALIDIVLVAVFAFDCFQGAIATFLLFLLFFGFGPGPIPWFMPAEMFDQAARPLALEITTFTNWASNAIVGCIFPILQLKIGFYCFLPFGIIGLVEFVFLLLFLPETTPKLAHFSPEIFAPGQPLVQLGRRPTQAELSERSFLIQTRPSQYA